MKRLYQAKKEISKSKKRFIKAAGNGTNSLATIFTRVLFYLLIEVVSNNLYSHFLYIGLI